MFPWRRNAMVYTLISVSPSRTQGYHDIYLFSVPWDGISASCLISLYFSIPLWMATQRGCPQSHCKQHSAVICSLGVLEWLRSQRLGPYCDTVGKVCRPWEMGLLGHLYEIGNRLEGVLGSGYVLSFCALALPSLLCNMFSYRRHSHRDNQVGGSKTAVWDNLLILIN